MGSAIAQIKKLYMKRIPRSPCRRCGTRGHTPGCSGCEGWKCALKGSEADLREYFEENQGIDGGLEDYATLTGSAVTVALVGCGKQKLQVRSKARDMYTGQLFKLSYAHALRNADDVLIISALHGLLSPFQEIDYYDLALNKLLLNEQRDWANGVVDDLFMAYPLTRVRLIFYAGLAYIRPILEAAYQQDGYWDIENPMEGLDLFQRLQWLRNQEQENDTGT